MREQSPRAAGLLCFDNEVFRTSQHKDRACGHLINRWILALPLFHPLKHWGINFQNDPSDSHLLGPHPLSHVGQRQLASPGGCAGRMRCDSQTWVIQGPVASSLLSLGALLWENQPCHWVGTLNKSWGEVLLVRKGGLPPTASTSCQWCGRTTWEEHLPASVQPSDDVAPADIWLQPRDGTLATIPG